ncbi:hypothetical protein, partial [Microcoleus sp. D3_18a_C4]
MSEPLKNQQKDENRVEVAPKEEALGIKHPLLAPNPLGNNFLYAKFLDPLGSRSINLINWSLTAPNKNLLQTSEGEENWQDFSTSEFQPLTQNVLTEREATEPPAEALVPPLVINKEPAEAPVSPSVINKEPAETLVPPSTIAETPAETPAPPPSTVVQTQIETPPPYRLEPRTRKNSPTAKNTNSLSHFFLQKSEFPRDKRREKTAVGEPEKPTESPDLSTVGDTLQKSSLNEEMREDTPTGVNRRGIEDVGESIGEIPQGAVENQRQTPAIQTRRIAEEREAVDSSKNQRLQEFSSEELGQTSQANLQANEQTISIPNVQKQKNYLDAIPSLIQPLTVANEPTAGIPSVQKQENYLDEIPSPIQPLTVANEPTAGIPSVQKQENYLD